MNIQRLRNLTTGYLHTDIGHVYEDLELLTGQKGVMTHMLPRLIRAIEPWLLKVVTDNRFWDDKYDPTHNGEYELPEPTHAEREQVIKNYTAQPDPLANKEVVVVQI